MENLPMDPGAVLAELSAIASARVTDFLAVEDGAVVVHSTKKLTPEQAAAVCSIEKSAGGIKVKFYDKLKALELLGKHMGLFEGGPPAAQSENDLIKTILDSTKEVISTHDLPEIQQAAAAGDDLVESPEAEKT